MIFGLNQDEIEAGNQRAAEMPFDPARDAEAGFFEGSLNTLKNIPETSASGLLLASNVIGGKLYGEQPEDEQIRADLVELQRQLRPDPGTTGMLGEVIYGLGKVLPQAVAGGVVAGPVGAAGVVGVTQGIEETERLKAEGVDPSTAAKAGTVEGITQGVGVVIPASMGRRLAVRLATGSALNVGLGGVSRGTTGAILRANGYNDMAEQYRVLDGAGLLTDAILGGIFGAAGHDPKISKHDAINDNLPGDLDMGLAANSVRQFELDSAPGIPTDIETRNAHTKAMDIGIEQILTGRNVDIGDTLENTTFLARARDPQIAEDFREAAIENGISPIVLQNRAREEAVVQSIVEQSMRNAGRSKLEAESVAPLFARTLARFANAFGEPITDSFNRSLLEFRQLDEQNQVVALGNNVDTLLNDVEALSRGEKIDPAHEAAVTDFGDRLIQLGITPEQARSMPAQQLLDQVYNVGKPVVEGSENMPTVEVGQNDEGQVTLSLRQSPQPVNAEHQAAITNRVMNAPPIDKSPLGFVSKMERTFDAKLNKTGTVDQFLEQINAFQKAGQFKADERFWSGLDDFLTNMKEMDEPDAKISKQDILDFLENNRFKLTEHGEQGEGVGPSLDEIRLGEFHEDYHIPEPDDSYIRENADEYYKPDILADLKKENDALPEDEQKTEQELEKEADEKAYDQALESYNDDPYNHTNTYTNSVDIPGHGTVDMEINSSSGGDYVEYKVGDRDWKEARSVDDALQEIHLALAEDYGVNFEGTENGPQFEEYTGEGGSNYRFFRLATDELKGGTYSKTGHYPEKNVLVHMRTKDRVGPNGEKMLFIEELQSDIHQQAYSAKRKSGIGYNTEISTSDYNKLVEDASAAQEESDRSYKETRALDTKIAGEISDDLQGLHSNQKSLLRDKIISTLNGKETGQVERGIIATDKIIDQAFDDQDAGKISDATYIQVKRAMPGLETEYSVNQNRSGNTIMAEPFDWKKTVNAYFDERINANKRGAGKSATDENILRSLQEAKDYVLAQPEPMMMSAAEINAYVKKTVEKYKEKWDFLTAEHKTAVEAERAMRQKISGIDQAPPLAPFSKTWREVGFKRLLARAADEGYESVGWTTGTQQNVRYNLSNFIDHLEARKFGDGTFAVKADRRILNAINQTIGGGETSAGFLNLTDEQLETALGKEGADAVRKQGGNAQQGFLSVDFAKEIELGGDRKGNLYDGMLPQEAGKILKKLDPAIKVAEQDYKITERGRDLDKIWYAPLTEKAKTEIMQGFELFQKERGAITFNAASAKDFEGRLKKIIIEFAKIADESTGIHEFSHWGVALHRMYADLARKRIAAGDLNPEIKRIADDWETLKKEVGAKDDVFTRDQEEKIAAWFEGYARTGIAPNEKLQPIFDRFKDWLTKIYEDITGKGMEVSPVVKGIFDRWLADADEIKAKQAKDAAALKDEGGTVQNAEGTAVSEPGVTQQVDPIQQIIAEKPDLQVTLENGEVVTAADAAARAQEDVAQAQKDASLFDVAINCFLRGTDA